MTDALDIVEAYARPSLGTSAHWDEMVDPTSGVRAAWQDMGAVLRVLGRDGLGEQRRLVGELLRQDGVTYRPYGAAQEQSWNLDPVPVLLDEAQWRRLEPALIQRAELLDLILTDLYGPRQLLAEGLIPPEIVLGHAGFVRAVDQVRLPAPRQLFLTATELARGPDGAWTVLGDRTQAPSGTGYAMANRRVISRSLPGLYRDTKLARIGPFFQAMRLALQALSPTPGEVPRVVLLTSGAGSETAFDQAFLSSLLGFPLVEGNDLLVRDGQVWQRSIGRLEPVDVILRRVDAWFCDPLELRGDSQLGVPGLVEASRLGRVSIANGLGTGVLENPALFGYLPRLAEVLLGQQLLLPSAQTWWCGEPTERRHVLANLDRLIVKPVSRRIVRTSRFGGELSAAQREELARWIEADPTAWVGQEVIAPSTAPSVGPAGLAAKPLVLRAFAVAHESSYRVMAGGLSLVAPEGAATIVTAQTGALAKDVWVLSGVAAPDEIVAGPEPVTAGRVVSAISPRVAEDLFWLGRYVERAEDISRLVAVTDNRWHDVHPGTEPGPGTSSDPMVAECVDVLLAALGSITALWTQPSVGPLPQPEMQLTAVIGNPVSVGTLAHDVRRIRELAAMTRDQLSTDTWAVLSDLDRGLFPFGARAVGARPNGGPGAPIGPAMGALREALLAFAGLAAESMVRDTGWHFMDAGRRLERSLQLVRLLQSVLVPRHRVEVESLVEESALIAAESIITHRRRYPAGSGVETIFDLLLDDRDNPRSLAYQLERLEVDLRRAAPEQDRLVESVRALAGRLRAADWARLARSGPGGRRVELDDFLQELVTGLHELAAAVERSHFASPGALRQLVPMAGFGALEAV